MASTEDSFRIVTGKKNRNRFASARSSSPQSPFSILSENRFSVLSISNRNRFASARSSSPQPPFSLLSENRFSVLSISKVKKFKIYVKRQDDEGALGWKITVCVKFEDDDPRYWGEMRAFGGFYGVKSARGVSDEDEIFYQVFDSKELQDSVNKEHLPLWDSQAAPLPTNKVYRIGNDQHMDIYYTKIIPYLRRSYTDPTLEDLAHNNEKIAKDPVSDPYEPSQKLEDGEILIPIPLHIVLRDEPMFSGLTNGDYVKYVHQAEFQIRRPGSFEVICFKRLCLKLEGTYPKNITSTIIM